MSLSASARNPAGPRRDIETVANASGDQVSQGALFKFHYSSSPRQPPRAYALRAYSAQARARFPFKILPMRDEVYSYPRIPKTASRVDVAVPRAAGRRGRYGDFIGVDRAAACERHDRLRR